VVSRLHHGLRPRSQLLPACGADAARRHPAFADPRV